jgi:hypothetical protein
MPDGQDEERDTAADAPREITLEEWIAATQSCCGAEPDSKRPKRPTE